LYRVNFLLKKYRIAAKLNQTQLAKLVGVSSGAINKYESNIINPKVDTWIKIANVLGIHPLDLIEIVEE
jgi:DNA-binding XRE family transcriptional regulator